MDIYTVNEQDPPGSQTVLQIGNDSGTIHGPYPAVVTTSGGHAFGTGIRNYTKRLKAGELLPHNNWDQQKPQKADVRPGRWYIEVQGNPAIYAEYTDSMIGLPLSYVPPYPNLSQADYALQKAAAEIYSQGWDALTFSAELPKTANMILGFQKKATNLARGLSKKKILDAWLEGRYGWRTLGYDVRDIHNAVYEMETKRDIFSERQGFTNTQRINENELRVFPPNMDGLLTTSGSIVESVRGSVSARISVSRARFNPLEAGWELVPFSFIVDWVYDVGTAIKAMSFLATSTRHFSSIGFKQTHQMDYELSLDRTYSGKANGEFTGGISFSGERVARIPTPISYSPQVTQRLATPDLVLDLTALSRLRRRLSSRR